MKLQYLCQLLRTAVLSGCIVLTAARPARPDVPPVHDFPTAARVEYVNDCIARSGGQLAALYQCACALDRIAKVLTYDEFVEASTFAKYAALPGAGGGIFRDSDYSRKLAKDYRLLEAESLRACGMTR